MSFIITLLMYNVKYICCMSTIHFVNTIEREHSNEFYNLTSEKNSHINSTPIAYIGKIKKNSGRDEVRCTLNIPLQNRHKKRNSE